MVYTGPFLSNPGSDESYIVYYNYIPSLAFNVIAAVLWGLLLLAHTYWLTRSRTTRIIQSLLVTGALLELIGYILRCVSHKHPFRDNLFIAQYVLLIITPHFFIMAFHLAFFDGGILNVSLREIIPVLGPRGWKAFFVSFAAITLILQTIGSSMLAVAHRRRIEGTESSFSVGNSRRLLLASFILKAIHLLLFLAVLTYALLRLLARPKVHVDSTATGTTTTGTVHPVTRSRARVFTFLVWLTTGMIFTRTLYRLAETAQGFYEHAFSSETLFGIFEFATVWTAVAVWAIRPFYRWLHDINDTGAPGVIEAKDARRDSV